MTRGDGPRESRTARRRRRAAVCGALALLTLLGLRPGCDCDPEECGGEEICDWLDNDCDGLVDEGFVGEDGLYSTVENCGGCGVRCADVFPTAAETACVDDGDGTGFRCVLVACPAGTRLGGAGVCVPDVDALCLPCERDADCTVWASGALCLATASGQRRCAMPCLTSVGCAPGFECAPSGGGDGGGWCRPTSGFCGCSAETTGVSFACLLETTGGQVCEGSALCDGESLGVCEAAFEEQCNGRDDDCDERTDEDFRVASGAYVHPDHCGECNRPCVPPGPNMVAECLEGPPISCERACAENFVDLDGIAANGCECERTVGTWPPRRLGVDADCDGTIDDSDAFVFVTPAGSDSNPGTLVLPMRTIQAGLARGAATGKHVLVAWGRYAGPVELVAGVGLFGGYAPDFSDRDPAIYPVVLENTAADGRPLLVCRELTVRTEVDGLTIQGSDAATVGAGATAVYLDRCGEAVRLANLIVYAGRGSDGAAGASSSQNLARWGLSSLRDLDGRAGSPGGEGVVAGTTVCRGLRVAGGAAGLRSCPGTGNVLNGGFGGEAVCPATGCVIGEPCGNAGCTDFEVDDECDREAMLADAVPNPAAGDGSGPGAGLAGERTYDAIIRESTMLCIVGVSLPRVGGNGGRAAPGTPGVGGAGCAATAGTFDAANGTWSARGGGNGTAGTDGGGGGGGTCGHGVDTLLAGGSEFTDALGGSGGGGGSGGCGAPAADGGGGGGASLGVVVRLPAGATRGPTLEGLQVLTAPGGNGGAGGQGASGGGGGAGGDGGRGTYWCAARGGRGGDGGHGGAGGGGGGGCGGSVSGIHVVARADTARAYVDELAAANTIDALASPGIGGSGGFSPGASGAPGASGSAEAVRLVLE